MKKINISPIGFFSCDQKYPQLLPRQGSLNLNNKLGKIELLGECNFDQALDDLYRFDKIWLVFLFHKNSNWKPKINTPRGKKKRGVFATRAPYRPNQIGLSCVTLISVENRIITVKDFDLLDKTPILDIKPYLPYADSFPNASQGWLDDETIDSYKISILNKAKAQLDWINKKASFDIEGFIYSQLSESPLDFTRKRLMTKIDLENTYSISARTWRINFKIYPEKYCIDILEIQSGYSSEDLNDNSDLYGDKKSHKDFLFNFKEEKCNFDSVE